MPLRITKHVIYPPRTSKPADDTAPRHGVRRDFKSWTARDDETVLKLYDPDGLEALAARLGRTVGAVKARATCLRTGRTE
jgi:hypothetical protein